MFLVMIFCCLLAGAVAFQTTNYSELFWNWKWFARYGMLIRTQGFFFFWVRVVWGVSVHDYLHWVFHSCSRISPLWDAPRFMAWHQSICSRNISLVSSSTLRWVIKDFLETNLGSIIGRNLVPYHPSFHCCVAKNLHFLLFNDSTWFFSLFTFQQVGRNNILYSNNQIEGNVQGIEREPDPGPNRTNILGLCLRRVHIINSLEFKKNKWSISVLVRTLSSCLCSCTELVVIQTPNSII